MESIVTLTEHVGGALPKDLKESDASHEAEGYTMVAEVSAADISSGLTLDDTTLTLASNDG